MLSVNLELPFDKERGLGLSVDFTATALPASGPAGRESWLTAVPAGASAQLDRHHNSRAESAAQQAASGVLPDPAVVIGEDHPPGDFSAALKPPENGQNAEAVIG